MKYTNSRDHTQDIFAKIIEGTYSEDIQDSQYTLKASLINTILGPIIAIADHYKLYLLKFADQSRLAQQINRLQIEQKTRIIPGSTAPIDMINKELCLYFQGKLKQFKTPMHIVGSKFQEQAWNALIQIPYGQTRSYLKQAETIGNKNAFRAIANANGTNPLIIIIPCHRIINNNGNLGGYSDGILWKKWLITHEQRYA